MVPCLRSTDLAGLGPHSLSDALLAGIPLAVSAGSHQFKVVIHVQLHVVQRGQCVKHHSDGPVQVTLVECLPNGAQRWVGQGWRGIELQVSAVVPVPAVADGARNADLESKSLELVVRGLE